MRRERSQYYVFAILLMHLSCECAFNVARSAT